jgi:hypothetical protein
MAALMFLGSFLLKKNEPGKGGSVAALRSTMLCNLYERGFHFHDLAVGPRQMRKAWTQ